MDDPCVQALMHFSTAMLLPVSLSLHAGSRRLGEASAQQMMLMKTVSYSSLPPATACTNCSSF